MNTNDESNEVLIILVSSIFGLISFIMSILSITTSGWQIDSSLNKTGLFRTCYKDYCTSIKEKHDISIIFAIIGQCFIGLSVLGSFLNGFIYRHRIGSIIVTILFFFGSLFLWITALTINSFLFMNGGSAIIFNAAIAFSLLATFISSYGLGTFFAVPDQSKSSIVPIKYMQTTMPNELYHYTRTRPMEKINISQSTL